MPEVPENAKTPDDRKQKKDKAAVDAVAAEAVDEPTKVEYNGVSYVLDAASYGDVDLVEDLQRYVDGNNLVVPRIVERLVGPEQYQTFKQANRDEGGRLLMAELIAFFHAIDEALGE